MIGRTLSHYKVLEKIGEGGMGDVYLAKDTKLDREVAVKVLPATFAENKERLARFEREAKLLAALNHPNIAAIHELEESDGVHFLALEYVPGETLAERIKRGPIPIDEALPLFKQIAEGLEAAHEKGVIHRDLKPANIKVTPESKVKVLDFGLAKAMAGEEPAVDASQSPTLTKDTALGAIMGTAAYMSPEQARGKPVDKRTDIWAFGCCLYEALSGAKAFLGQTVTDTIAAVVKNEPNWEALPATSPALLRSVLRRCLQKDATHRLHDIADARIEIEEAISDPEPIAHTTASFTVGRTGAFYSSAVFLFAVVALASTAFAIWNWMHRTNLENVTLSQFVLPLPKEQVLDLLYKPVVAISRDGSKVVCAATRGGAKQLFLRRIDGLAFEAIPGTLGASDPFFSPDGKLIGFHDSVERRLKKVSLQTGIVVNICEMDIPSSRGASWGPTGLIVFASHYGSHTSLYEVPAEGGEPKRITNPDFEQGERSHRWPTYLPDGNHILFTVEIAEAGRSSSFDEARIEIVNLESGERRILIEGGSGARYVPTGHIVYSRAGALLAAPFDVGKNHIVGDTVPILEGIVADPQSGASQFAISNNGSLVYVRGQGAAGDRTLAWTTVSGDIEPVIQARRPFRWPRLTATGDHLAVTIGGFEVDIWSCDLIRSQLARLTFEGDNEHSVWIEGENRVVFSSNFTGTGHLYWRDAGGSGVADRLTSGDFSQRPTSTTPDGKQVIFEEQNPNTKRDVWLLPLEGDRKPRPLLNTYFNEGSGEVSPDGNWFAYISDESGRYEVYISPFPALDDKLPVSTYGGTEPRWSPDGRRLFYRTDDKLMSVPLRRGVELSVGEPKVVFDDLYERGLRGIRNFDVHPDGQRFLMVMHADPNNPRQVVVVLNWTEELKRLVSTN